MEEYTKNRILIASTQSLTLNLFYNTDDLDKKFEIIKSNLKIIENDLIVDNRFRDDIWLRLKSNQDRLFDGWENYFYKKIDEFKNV